MDRVPPFVPFSRYVLQDHGTRSTDFCFDFPIRSVLDLHDVQVLKPDAEREAVLLARQAAQSSVPVVLGGDVLAFTLRGSASALVRLHVDDGTVLHEGGEKSCQVEIGYRDALIVNEGYSGLALLLRIYAGVPACVYRDQSDSSLVGADPLQPG